MLKELVVVVSFIKLDFNRNNKLLQARCLQANFKSVARFFCFIFLRVGTCFQKNEIAVDYLSFPYSVGNQAIRFG